MLRLIVIVVRALGCAIVAILLAGCAGERPGTRALALSECRLPKLALAAQCGTLDVPEDRRNPSRRTIAIAVALLPANTLNPKPDALFVLAGGPGQAASHLGPFASQLVGVRKDRDIVLVDQRGTGRSSPLDCAALKPHYDFESMLELDPAPKAAQCARELADKGIDASQYTTAAFVEDLDAVRAALGYSTINLWGGSYGTRAALEYVRRHRDRVRSVVLDGVAPPSMRVSLDVWPTRDAALDALIRACNESHSCAASHPNLDATLSRIRDRLSSGSTVTIVDPRTGEARDIRLTFAHVVAALQPLTYVPQLGALMPEVINRMDAGDFGPLYATASLTASSLAEQVNSALHYSVTCAEDVPRVTAADLAALASVRSRELARALLSVCDVWPRGDAPADAATPVVSDVPALLISGGLDPVTPPPYGAEVARALSHSRHIVALGYGHIVTPHACAPRLVAAFIDDPSFASLPSACVDHFERSVRTPLWPDRLAPQP
jgi:pimeloyl-ACP methyl ester carboxylesterase